MIFTRQRRPRGFKHDFIYVNDRKNRWRHFNDNARSEMNAQNDDEASDNPFKGRFTKVVKHLEKKKYKRFRLNSFEQVMKIVVAVVVLVFLWFWLTD